MSDYKTGIDTTFSGSSGTDYLEEFFYHDVLISDRKVVYIKAATTITLAHNARNVSYAGSGTYEPVSGGNNGTILYKIDRDLQWGNAWGDAGSAATFYTFAGGTQSISQTNNTTYSSPFSLTSVAGVTGASGTITNWGTYYWNGILDSVGDEWHVLTVADYDSFISDPEGKSSDGKIILFVVNPKTPCLTVAATGDAQFYTTPPKIYFIPKIHDQTTYFNAGTGSITITLTDINGNNIFWRIGGGAYTDAGSSTKTFTASDFASGSNTLQYYYAGNAAYTKTRTVVKNPGFPSAGETHGDMIWGSGNWSTISARLDRAPYATPFAAFVGNDSTKNPLTSFDSDYRTGKRIHYGEYAWTNALAAKKRGWTVNANGKSKTSALYAKQMLLDSERNIDPVGFELNHSGSALPTRELYYRGYYDMNVTFSLAFAYDLLIGNSASMNASERITAIEDYFIRDALAGCAMDAMMAEGNYTSQEYADQGMWQTSRNIGGFVVAAFMPTYSTPYYGTSGFDGVTTTTYAWTPFPDTPLTWKKVFLDNDASLVGYPNLNYRFSVEEFLCTSDGKLADKIAYINERNMGHIFAVLGNISAIHAPSKTWPNMQTVLTNLANGTVLGTDADPTYAAQGYATPYGPARYSNIGAYNSRFPNSAPTGGAWMRSLPNTTNPYGDNESEPNSISRSQGLALVFYDDTYTSTGDNGYKRIGRYLRLFGPA